MQTSSTWVGDTDFSSILSRICIIGTERIAQALDQLP